MRTPASARPALPPSPGDWFAQWVRPLFDDCGPYDPGSGRWVGTADLLGDGGRQLRSLHARICERERTPGATAATYLAGWFPGFAAEAVGLALATAGAGLVLDADQLRWHLHPDLWPERIEIGDIGVVVTPDHQWAGLDDVSVVASVEEVVDRSVSALVAAVEPLIEGCHQLARVGRVGLWNEIGDGIVMVLRHHRGLGVDQAMIDIVSSAARRPGVPWRARAELRLVDTPWGPACVGRKGGCCLAYKRAAAPDADQPTDPVTIEFWRRFPVRPDEPRYCGTCSLRDRADAEARQLFWFEVAHTDLEPTTEH